MFEFAKLLFALAIVVAAMMVPKGIKDMHDDFALRRGDTTTMYRINREWEERMERDRVRLDSTLQINR